MHKIGLKVWSTNLNYIPIIRDLFDRKIFDYIELFTVPGSLETVAYWKSLDIPFVLHAPHSAVGLNPGDNARREDNSELVRQVDVFFHALSPEFVIFHPGVDGSLDEAIAQFRFYGERFPAMYQKIVIENKPQRGLNDEKCLGASPREIDQLLKGTGRGFCFDSTHAICYAQSAKLPWKNVLKDFMLLKPVIFHICDGHYAEKDAHLHLGDGEYDLDHIIRMLPLDGMVSLETPKDSRDNLNDFIKDVGIFRSFIKNRIIK
jgi:deoxyribonuclease-4